MRSLKVVAVIAAFFMLAACNNEFEWHQKLTVVVQTPDGELSGSSVTKVTKRVSDGFFTFPEARGVFSGISREAVVVEVTEGKYLFVLLDRVDDLAYHAFPQFPYEGGSEFRGWERTIEEFRGQVDVPRDKYPMMVVFEDIDDPTTLKIVSPASLWRHFGSDIVLQTITLEITEEEATFGYIENLVF